MLSLHVALPIFFKVSFNHTVQVESRPEHLTGEAGALIQREIMDRLGIIEWLGERLTDPRVAARIGEAFAHSLNDAEPIPALALHQSARLTRQAVRPGIALHTVVDRGM